jgi:hypothetical protein
MALSLVGLVAMLWAPGACAAPWRITHDHWSHADEMRFEDFVQAIGETNCSSSESCLRNAANPYRNSDQAFVDVDVDCAKLPYLLRGYFAWKNGLPFSYASRVSGEDNDLRYTKSANRVAERHDIVDPGEGIDAPETLRTMLSSVYSGSYRTDPDDERGLPADFYSPALRPGSIRRGTIVYDINGHVGIVYKVDGDGRIYYMDAHPDFSITRSVYGAQFGQSPMHLGGGFKNWRPFRLVGARRNSAGHWIGGHIVHAKNAQVPEFSLTQYTGTAPNPSADVKKARFVYDGVALGFYEYVRAAVSGGKTSYNPVFELQATMRSLCNDLNDRAQSVDQAIAERVPEQLHPSKLPDDIYDSHDTIWESYATPARDARIRAAFLQFQRDLGNIIRLWINRDPRVVYDGHFLRQDLQQAYAQESQACTVTYLNSTKHPVPLTFDEIAHRLFRLSFDPYDCIELRWGATGDERATCTDGAHKLRWYDSEQTMRDRIDRTAGAPEGTPMHPSVDIKSLIDSMGEQVSFQGMIPVGR